MNEDALAVGVIVVLVVASFGLGILTFYLTSRAFGFWPSLALLALATLFIADYSSHPSFLGIRYTSGGVWLHLSELLYGLVLGVPFLLGGAIGVFRGTVRNSATRSVEKTVE